MAATIIRNYQEGGGGGSSCGDDVRGKNTNEGSIAALITTALLKRSPTVPSVVPTGAVASNLNPATTTESRPISGTTIGGLVCGILGAALVFGLAAFFYVRSNRYKAQLFMKNDIEANTVVANNQSSASALRSHSNRAAVDDEIRSIRNDSSTKANSPPPKQTSRVSSTIRMKSSPSSKSTHQSVKTPLITQTNQTIKTTIMTTKKTVLASSSPSSSLTKTTTKSSSSSSTSTSSSTSKSTVNKKLPSGCGKEISNDWNNNDLAQLASPSKVLLNPPILMSNNRYTVSVMSPTDRPLPVSPTRFSQPLSSSLSKFKFECRNSWQPEPPEYIRKGPILSPKPRLSFIRPSSHQPDDLGEEKMNMASTRVLVGEKKSRKPPPLCLNPFPSNQLTTNYATAIESDRESPVLGVMNTVRINRELPISLHETSPINRSNSQKSKQSVSTISAQLISDEELERLGVGRRHS